MKIGDRYRFFPGRAPRKIDTCPRFWLSLLVVLFGAAVAADAALSVSPTRIVVQAQAGQARKGGWRITNDGAEPLTVRVQPEDWSGGAAGTRAPVAWLKVTPSSLTLGPGKSADIAYRIRVPTDASGELRAQVFFTTDVPQAAMPMRSRLGTILYVGVDGTEEIAAAITDVKAFYTPGTPGVEQPDRLEIALRIRNDGNTHIVPQGAALVRGPADRVAATVPLTAGWGLLPREEDAYRAVGHGVYLKPGAYRLELELVCGADLGRLVPLRAARPMRLEEDGRLVVGAPEPPVEPP